MRTEKMRKQLQAFIGHAEKEKVKAMYTLFQEWIKEPAEPASGDVLSDALVAEMDAEYEAIERGELKAYSLEEVLQRIDAKRRERYGEDI